MRLKLFIVLIVLPLCLSVTSCAVSGHYTKPAQKEIPPGQAKKIYGDRSAKNYAPGQTQNKDRHKD